MQIILNVSSTLSVYNASVIQKDDKIDWLQIALFQIAFEHLTKAELFNTH